MKSILRIAYKIVIGLFVWGLSIGIVNELGNIIQLPEKMNALISLIVPVIIAVIIAAKAPFPQREKKQKPVIEFPDDNEFNATAAHQTPTAPKAEPSVVSTCESVPRRRPQNAAKPSYPTRTYKVAGVSYHTDVFEDMAVENSDYDMDEDELIEAGLIGRRVWQYDFYPDVVEVVPEPTNIYNSNAIKVVVDDELIGYIKDGSCAHLNKVISEGRLGRITCTMGGGPYKYVTEDEDGDYEMDEGEARYFAELHIEEL